MALLGLTYKPDTDTLRRSTAVTLCAALLERGSNVAVFDPAVSTLPDDLRGVMLCESVAQALDRADAAIVCTAWPQFRAADWSTIIPTMQRALIIDANRLLVDVVTQIDGVEYRAVGMPV